MPNNIYSVGTRYNKKNVPRRNYEINKCHVVVTKKWLLQKMIITRTCLRQVEIGTGLKFTTFLQEIRKKVQFLLHFISGKIPVKTIPPYLTYLILIHGGTHLFQYVL
jgi:hypothetical protein